jgi:hypothetical protein
MPGFRHGAKRGIILVLIGFLIAVISGTITPYLRDTGLVPWWTFYAMGAVAVISLSLTVKVSKYWSYRYLGGFVIGIVATLPFLLQTMFLDLREVSLYGGVAVAAVLLRTTIDR